MEKVLVAGATGYLGRFVAKEFKRRGFWGRILAREKSLAKLERQGPFLEISYEWGNIVCRITLENWLRFGRKGEVR